MNQYRGDHLHIIYKYSNEERISHCTGYIVDEYINSDKKYTYLIHRTDLDSSKCNAIHISVAVIKHIDKVNVGFNYKK